MHDLRTAHDALCAHLDEIPKTHWRDLGVWGDDWTVSDLVAHLAEWQRLFLSWYEDGLDGITPQMPAPGYKWSELPKLNRAIREKHRSRSLADVIDDFETGYARILRIVDELTSTELLNSGALAWTGKHPLTTYLGANTASHYRFGLKVIRRWLRSVHAMN